MDSNGASLGYSDITAMYPGAISSWTRVGGRVTAPANSAWMQVQYLLYQSSGWVNIDDVEVTIVPPNAASEVTKYYYFGGQRVAMRKNGVLTYLHADHLGSTVLETNITGTVTSDERYLAYGKQRDSGKVTTDHRFTGQKEDGSGLMYYGARFYDPQTGMFVSPDTMVPDAGLVSDYNRYMYARGNAMKYHDSSGHGPECAEFFDGEPIGATIATGCEIIEDAPEIVAEAENLATELIEYFTPVESEVSTVESLTTEETAMDEQLSEAGLQEEGATAEEATENLPCANSFSSDTVVLTSDGLEPIMTLTIGDQVYAYNEATGQTGLYTVTATMAHLDPVLVTLVIDGETIHTTPAHPFYANGHWVDAGKLHVGDTIRKEDGTVGDVENVTVAHHAQVMYNLTVAQAHTFFVGSGQWLVHNAGCAGGFLDNAIKAGDWHIDEIDTSYGKFEIAATAEADGTALTLSDTTIYASGKSVGDLGTKGVTDLLNQLATAARERGYDTLRIIGDRVSNSTSANPGHTFDIVLDLTKPKYNQ